MSDAMLVGIDGSEGSRRAAEFAAHRAKRSGAHLVVVYVIEWSPYTFNTPEENDVRHKRREEEIERAQTQVLNPMVEALKSKGVDVEGIVRHGHAAEVLTGLAKENSVVQIFIGRLGQSTLKSLLFGSVAGHLVQTSPVPVTVVP